MAAAEAQTAPAVEQANTVTDKAPEKVDKKELEAEIKKIEEEIAERKKVVDSVRTKLDGLKESSAAGREKSKPEDDKLKQMRDASKKLVEARRAIFEEMTKSSDKVKALREKHDTVRKSLKDIGVYSPEKVDEKIKEREYYLTTHSLSLKEEKDIHAEMKQLQNSKKLITEVDQVRLMKEAEEAQLKELREKHDAAKAELDKAKTAEKKQQEKRDSMRPKGVESKTIDKWKADRTQARADIDELFKKIKSLREEAKKKDDVFYAWVKERRKEQEAKRKEEEAKRKEEDKLRRLQREEEEQDGMHAESFAAIEQLTEYLNKYTKDSGETKEEAKVEEFKIEGQIGKAARGFDEDVFGTKGKSKSKKGKSKKKQPAFNLDLGLMKEFDALKITAPLSAEDIPAALTALQAKKKELEQDKEKKKVARMKKIAEMTDEKANESKDADKPKEEKKAKDEKAESKKEEKAEEKAE